MEIKFQVTVRSASETDPELLRRLENSSCSPVRIGENLYSRIGDKVFSCKDNPEGETLFRTLCGEPRNSAIRKTEEQYWKDLLCGTADLSLLRKYNIREENPRCVILFRIIQDSADSLQREIIPLEETDRIAELGNGEEALILDMKKRSPEEAYEYAAAVAETMESEAGITCMAGIGRTVSKAGLLYESCSEARKAITTGIHHKMGGRVFVYSQQTLERLADLIPSAEGSAFRKELIPPHAEKVLTDETLETIRVFFRNDLNLSTASRQLFIHRNTLIYRMDKIRKATGLDLRKFEDAVVFRMIMNISKEE